MTIFKRDFWYYAGERAIKTIAQTLIATLTAGAIAGILDVAWIPLLSSAALAGVVSVLTSLVNYDPYATADAYVAEIRKNEAQARIDEESGE